MAMFAIVTDSTSGLSRAEAKYLGIDIVPMAYITDGRRHFERPAGENGDYEELFSASHLIRTEGIYPHAFSRVIAQRMNQGYDVLCVTISGRLSGTYRSARDAASALNEGRQDGRKAIAVDSWSTSGGLEYVLRYAARLSLADTPLAAAAAQLEQYRKQQLITFAVPDIDVLRRSGRPGMLRRSMVSMLNRYPVMMLTRGGITEVGMAHGASGMGREMATLAPQQAQEFVITHYGIRGIEAQRLLAAVKARFPHAQIRVKDGGPVLTENLGPGAVALTWRQVGEKPMSRPKDLVVHAST
jgi:DegV family protein with EDD domain